MHNLDICRHWHEGSEPYTGGDSLVAALQDGFEINLVFIQAKPLYGWRTVNIYRFELKRGETTLVMSVIANPFVARLVASLGFAEEFPNEQVQEHTHVEKGTSQNQADL